jgi:hypothetical protein
MGRGFDGTQNLFDRHQKGNQKRKKKKWARVLMATERVLIIIDSHVAKPFQLPPWGIKRRSETKCGGFDGG